MATTKYIVDNLTGQTISGNLTINGNLNVFSGISTTTISATTYSNLPLGGPNYIFVYANGTPTENATELQDAYNTAITMSPSSANTITLVLAPGEYQFPSAFTANTEYINIVSLTGNKDVIFDLSGITDPFDSSVSPYIISECLLIDADNVFVKGIKGKFYLSPNFNSTFGLGEVYILPIQVSSNLPNIIVENCEGGPFSFGGAGGDSDVSGTYTDCIGGLFSFGGSDNNSTVSGTFNNCTGGNFSFGGAGDSSDVSGTFNNCTGGDLSFGGAGGDSNVSGTFNNCQGGNASFGGEVFSNVSGTFTNCTGGNYSFGGGAGNSDVSGTFTDCTGGDLSFGGGGNSDVSGTFNNCTGGNFSFGGDYGGGTVSGTFISCIGGEFSFGGVPVF
jgi:hypothetical protein